MTTSTATPTVFYSVANPDYSDQPTLTVNGWTVIITGTDEEGISLSVQSNREVTGQWAAPEHSVKNRVNFAARRVPLPIIVTPTEGLAATPALVYTARYTPWERDPKYPNQQRRFWQQTIHYDWCRHAKSASPLTVFDRKELDAHGFEPFSRHGGSLSRYTGCRVCHTGNFTKEA
jgi:hypothetical protein